MSFGLVGIRFSIAWVSEFVNQFSHIRPFTPEKVWTRQAEIKELPSTGILTVENDFETKKMEKLEDQAHSFLVGKVSAVVDDSKPAQTIADEIVEGTVKQMKAGSNWLTGKSKLKS